MQDSNGTTTLDEAEAAAYSKKENQCDLSGVRPTCGAFRDGSDCVFFFPGTVDGPGCKIAFSHFYDVEFCLSTDAITNKVKSIEMKKGGSKC
jgi:hypothetical protein